MKPLVWAGLVLLVGTAGGCRKDEPSSRPEVYAPVSGAPIQGVQGPGEKVLAQPAAAPKDAKALPTGTAAEISVGMSRAALVEALGECAVRTDFIPAVAPGQLTVESFQPKGGPCAERFGLHQYQVVGGVVKAIRNGLSPQPPPAGAPDEKRPPSALAGPQ